MTTLKEKIENNAVVILITTSFVVGSGVAGVQRFFHKKDKERIEAKYKDEIKGNSLDYKYKIKDLNDRLLAIKRRVGEEIEYQDVSKFSITSSMIRTLGNEITPYF